jgi:hypothetical protein
MTSADRNDLMPNQKLEWATPKISLMEAEDTQGKAAVNTGEGRFGPTGGSKTFAPS